MGMNELYRPSTLDDVAGQIKAKKIVGKMLDKGEISSLIFYGPSGCGKTTIANIIAANTKMDLYQINGTAFATADFKKMMKAQEDSGKTLLVYLDEIQYLTQKQQQLFLEPVETGKIILIAATADSPYHKVYKALLSRCVVVEFVPVSKAEIKENLKRIIDKIGRSDDYEEDALDFIARVSGGDVRSSVKLLDLVNGIYENEKITAEKIKEITPSSQPIGYDGTDSHFDLMGCLQKSIRGSDIDASLFYLAKMLNDGEMLAVIRRLQVIASEDIGMANPNVAAIVRACCESAVELGMPEAGIPLHHAVAVMALSPKSNSVHEAYGKAMEDVQNGMGILIPPHLQAPLFKGYRYPHMYPDNWCWQQYLPDDIKDRKYYVPGKNKNETVIDNYWQSIKKSTKI